MNFKPAGHLGSLILSNIYIAGYSSRDQESKYAMLLFSWNQRFKL